MKRLSRFVVPLVLVLVLAACGSSTAPRVQSTAPVASSTAAADETVEFSGLTEFEDALMGAKNARGGGTMEITPTALYWHNDAKPVRSFSLRPEVLETVWLNCAARAGGNLCLELGIETLTDNQYFFRDRDWEAGGNGAITAVFERLQEEYPQVRFDRRTVKAIK